VDTVLERKVPGPYHYYSAYPRETVRTVGAALALRRSFERFQRETRDLEADEFAERWRVFLTQEQHNL
jgi:hypothetical protein